MKKIYDCVFTLFLAMLVSASAFAQRQTNYYVSVETGKDSNNGSSWNLAFKTIDKALTAIDPATNDGTVFNIYIAQGYYKITRNSEGKGNRFTGNKTIRFLGGYPVPNKHTPDNFICSQSPLLYPVTFDYLYKNSVFRVGKPTGKRETKSTDLYFSGINYRNTSLNGGTGDGTFLTVDATAKNSTVTMENMIISAYKSSGAGFIYYYETEDCIFNADKIFVTRGGHATGDPGGGFLRTLGSAGKPNKNLTVRITNSTFTRNSMYETSGAGLICVDGKYRSNNNQVIIENNRFCKNTTTGALGKGVALQLFSLSKCVIKNNRFEANKGHNGILYLNNVSFRDEANNLVPLSGNVWIDNSTTNGGAIYAEGIRGGFLIDGDQYSGNTATGDGGALYVKLKDNNANDTAFIIKNSTFCGNKSTGGQGGGVYATNLHLLKTENNLFYGNRAEGVGGGGICLIRAGAESTKDQFYNNFSQQGGGAISAYGIGSTVKATESLFDNNQANTDVGGAIRAGEKTISINCIYTHNSTGKSGGAIWTGDELESTGDIYKNNTAATLGGAVHIYKARAIFKKGKSFVVFDTNTAAEGGAIYKEEGVKLEVSDAIFQSNTASKTGSGNGGGAVYVNRADYISDRVSYMGNRTNGSGGAIMIANGSGTLELKGGNIFTGNIAEEWGGAVCSILEFKQIFKSEGSKFKGNEAKWGGALYITKVAGAGTDFTGKNNVFVNNTTKESAGAIYFHGNNMTFNTAHFYGNNTKNEGGAIYFRGHELTCNTVKFHNNVAKGKEGGAIYLNGTTSTFSDSEFFQNKAFSDGGAIYCPSGADYVYFKNSKSYGNSVNGNTTTPNSSEFWIDKSGSNYSTDFYIQESSKVQLPIDDTHYPHRNKNNGTFRNGYSVDGSVNQSTSGTVIEPNITPTSMPEIDMPKAKECPKASTVICPVAADVLDPEAIITTNEGTLIAPDLNASYCYPNRETATITMSSLTGKAPFTFEYKIVAIDGAEKKVSESEKLTLVTDKVKELEITFKDGKDDSQYKDTVKVGYATVNLKDFQANIPNKGVSYRYEILKVTDANGKSIEYDCAPPLSALLNVNPQPVVKIKDHPKKVCLGQELQLVAEFTKVETLTPKMQTAGGEWGNSESVTWKWTGPAVQYANNTNTNKLVIPNAKESYSGEYTLTAVDNNGCEFIKKLNIKVGRCEGVWIGTIDTEWNKPGNWKFDYPAGEGDDVIFATKNNNGGVAAKNNLHVPGTATNPTIINNLTNNSKKALVVPAGKAITIQGKVSATDMSTNPNKLIVKAEAGEPNGTLILADQPCGDAVKATVELYAKGEKGHSYSWQDNIPGSPDNGKETFTGEYSWQHFGVPVKSVVADPAFYKAYLREYDEGKNDDQHFYHKWKDLDNSSKLVAFKGYEITQDKPTKYAIQGDLVFCEQLIELQRTAKPVKGASGNNERYGLGQNIFGNSFTASIPIENIDFSSVEVDDKPADNSAGNLVEHTVYLYNTGTFGEWGENANNVAANPNPTATNAGTYKAIPHNNASSIDYGKIPSMNGFLLRHVGTDGSKIKMKLPYNKLEANTKAQTAPKAPLSYLEVELASKSTVDRLWLFSQEGTTEGFDNGWDGRKFFGTPTAFIYSETPAGNMQVNTTETLENKVITFYANQDMEYTLYLKKNELQDYTHLTLLDIETGNIVPLNKEITEYNFTAKAPNVVSKRFKIVNSRNITDEMLHEVNGNIEIQQLGNKISVTNYTQQTGVMQVFDVTGKLIMSKSMRAGINKYELHLDRGAYIVTGSTDTGNGQKRIIVQ